MVALADSFRSHIRFGRPLATIVDDLLPGLLLDPAKASLIEALRECSTLPDNEQGRQVVRRGLARNFGPSLVPDMSLPPRTRAQVAPDAPNTISFNYALLQAFGDVSDDARAQTFIMGTIFHELAHWGRRNHPDTSVRNVPTGREYGEEVENIFHGRGRLDGPVPLPARLEDAFAHRTQGAGMFSANVSTVSAPQPILVEKKDAAPMALKRISQIAGVPLHYDRFNADRSDYGTIGKPVSPEIEPAFLQRCEEALQSVRARLEQRFGKLKIVVTGGIARPGSGESYHHQNRAFDLDALSFESTLWVANTFPQRPHLYLAIESDLRRHFGTVLTYDYNPAHQDHIHFDDGRDPKFRKSAKTHSLYVQNALHFVYMKPVGTDGVWGPETETAAKAILKELGIGPLSDVNNWMKFCDVTAMHALEMAS